ncbi:uncharacterized protein (DUF983 family) [Parvularcula dongshanensis]|uniref:Uncharacterized protein (DUF983 family) n=2 Tax=Parvularcula dongshanensis TaxID=1173995 RepID=A0A840I675_9PROT|nr:uncharacterized protein (DUF983 family) [Parvularcula dongshanensis]
MALAVHLAAMSSTALQDDDRRPFWRSVLRGARNRCPRCGQGRVLRDYVKVRDACAVCGQDFSGHEADDAPPYLTIFVVGHLIAVPVVEVKRRFDPPLGAQVLGWCALAIVLTILLLPVCKGALIGLQWANRMHGFAQTPDDPEDVLRS